MTETTKKNKKIRSSRAELIYIGLGVVAVFFIWWIYPKYLFWNDSVQPEPTKQIVIPYQFDAMLNIKPAVTEPLKDEEDKTELQLIGDQFGTFGDSYGSLNTLFSGLAFAMLVASLYLQRKELQAQRIEIEDQKDEIKKGNEIAEGQKTITDQQRSLIEQQLHDSKVQNFYTLLFKFLDEKNRKVDELNLLANSGNFKGETLFDKFIYYIEMKFEENLNYVDFENQSLNSELLESIITQASDFANDHTLNALLNSEYFEYLCFIFRFIESHKNLGITEDAIKVFISYQSFNESYAMFIFSIYLQDEELQAYITKYALLRKLRTFQTKNENFDNLVDFFLGEDATTP